MCQSGCKCVKPCVSCSCSKQKKPNKSPVDLKELQDYTLRYSVAQIDSYYQDGLQYMFSR